MGPGTDGPQDGFTEHTGFGTPFYDPHWGISVNVLSA